MSLGAAALAACAMWLALARGPRGARWSAVPRASRARPQQVRKVTLAILALLGVVSGCWITLGHRGAVVGAVVAILGATAGVIVIDRVQHARARARRQEVTQACAALAGVIAAGRVPSEALRAVAQDWTVLEEAAVTVSLGGDPAATLLQQASLPGGSGLASLGRAWAVSGRTGAPLADLVDAVAQRLRADSDLRHTVQTELASARATGRLLAALPLVGLGLGFAFGGNPLAFLLDNPVGWGCLLGGSVCASAGVIWNERLADRAEAW